MFWWCDSNLIELKMANLNRLSGDDYYYQCHLKLPGDDTVRSYYNSVDALRPLLTSKTWVQSAHGFFINVGEHYAARLTCFTPPKIPIVKLITAFAGENNLQNLKETDHGPSHGLSGLYGGDDERRLRRFLSIMALIALDILRVDRPNAQSLLATFRWQVMATRKEPEPHFARTFKQSDFYNKLLPELKNQFWDDMKFWPKKQDNQVDWAHLFVNMVLAGDWIQIINSYPFQHLKYMNYFQAVQHEISISQINNLLPEIQQDFQISSNWKP